MAIADLRKIEAYALDVVKDPKRYLEYLKVVAKTSQFRWYNSMIIFRECPNVIDIDTASRWDQRGYDLKVPQGGKERGFDILIPKYSTDYVSRKTGDAVDTDALTEEEFAEALSKGIIYKRKTTVDMVRCRVYDRMDVSDGEEDPSPESIPLEPAELVRCASAAAQICEEPNAIGFNDNLVNLVKRAALRTVGRMRKESDIGALIIKPTEVTLIADSVAAVVCSYLGLSLSTFRFEYLPGWYAYLHKNGRIDSLVVLRCLDQVSLASNDIIKQMDRALGREKVVNEAIIDKSYTLNDLLKAAEANFILQQADVLGLESKKTDVQNVKDGGNNAQDVQNTQSTGGDKQ